MYLTSPIRKTMLAPDTTIIAKELIAGLRFPKQPVAIPEEQRKAIHAKLLHATKLGNTEHGKCRITFHDDEGMKAVETTIWTYDQDNIVLKYGMVIPIARVVSVDIL